MMTQESVRGTGGTARSPESLARRSAAKLVRAAQRAGLLGEVVFRLSRSLDDEVVAYELSPNAFLKARQRRCAYGTSSEARG